MKINDLKTALHNYFQSLNRLKELGIATNKKTLLHKLGNGLLKKFIAEKERIVAFKNIWI